MSGNDGQHEAWRPGKRQQDADRRRSGEQHLDAGREGDAERDLPDGPDVMFRDDEFLLEEDREYVLGDEGRSWREYVSPVLFAGVLLVMLGDVVTTGVGLAMGLNEANPLVAAVIREVGLGGLVLVKAVAAMLLLLLPGVTDSAEATFRAGSALYLVVGVAVVLSNVFTILTVA